MAISKLILNGDVQMDVTSDTVSANRMLNGYTATKNDGTKVTGNIATKSAADMTASGSTVTAAAGYYATATSKNVGAGSAFTPAVTITKNPTISLTSSTGAVTASYAGSSSVTPTVTAGYVAAGTAGTVSTSGTSTYQLASKAAATYNTSTADQTIGSYQWLTGTQTVKSVTTSNLTAANIAEGVVVKVGDANNASRITQITGTHSGATSYTATISGTGNTNYCYVTYNGTTYRSNGDTFTYKAGDTLTVYCRGNSLTINGGSVTLSSYSYTYTLPVGDITINITYSSSTNNNIKIWGLVQPTGTSSITGSGTFNVYGYSAASVGAGAATTPGTTITKNPTFSFASATGVVTASYTGSSSITPTITSGYVTAGTAGTVSTTGTSTYQLTTQAAQTITPSTTVKTISSYVWLTGTQTIASIQTSWLSNIVPSTSPQTFYPPTGTFYSRVDTGAVITETRTVDPSTAAFDVIPESGKFLSKVTVNPIPSTYIQPTGTSTITSNGTYDVKTYANATVNVTPRLQAKTVDPSDQIQVITPDTATEHSVVPASTTMISSSPLTTSIDLSFLEYGKRYQVTGRFMYTCSSSVTSDLIDIDTIWTASDGGSIDFTISDQHQASYPEQVTLSKTQLRVYMPSGTTFYRGSIANGSMSSNTLNFTCIDDSYEGLSQVTVNAAQSSGATLGSFEVTPTTLPTTTTNIMLIALVTRDSSVMPNPPLLIYFGNTGIGYTRTYYWPLSDDGYMYVAVLGSTDSYWPRLTATSGTATVVTSSVAGQSSYGNYYKRFAHVWYKISDGAEVNLDYYNNN